MHASVYCLLGGSTWPCCSALTVVCCGAQGLRSLFGTLIVALPAFWNVGGLLALMFFIYAYVGMLLLGHVKRNG
jgi:hypothetical protein